MGTCDLARQLHLSRTEVTKMKKGLLILAATLTALAPVSAPAQVRGFVMVGPSYYGGYYRPYWGSMYGGYYANPYAGEVKLNTKVKDAGVAERRVVA